ncbi:MAG: hypothetical protein ABJE10_03955, partial [bacterium]
MSLTAYVSALLLWSALHLVWQGALVVAAFSWWQRTMRPSPSMRYRAAVSCVVVLAAAFIINGMTTHFALLENARLGADGAVLAETVGALRPITTMFDRSFDGIAILALVWSVGVVANMLRLALGVWHCARLH